MKTKPEIKEKLKQAEEALPGKSIKQDNKLQGVINALRWVLGVKITQGPQDPVTEE